MSDDDTRRTRRERSLTTRVRAVTATAGPVVGATTEAELVRAIEATCRAGGLGSRITLATVGNGGLVSMGEPAGEPSPSVWERAARGRRPVLVPGAGSPVLIAPLWSGDRSVGALALERASALPSDDDIEVAVVVAALAAAGLDAVRAAEARRAAHDAARLSEHRFRAVFEQHPISMQVFDAEGWTLDVNRAWERTFGMSRDQLGGFNPLRDPQLADVRELLERGFAGETVTVPPHPFTPEPSGGAPGEEHWLEVTVCPVCDDSGDIREVIVTHHDVTAKHEAEEALHRAYDDLDRRVQGRTAELAQAEARFRAIVEASPTPLLISRLDDGTILYANERLDNLVGAEPGTLIGRATPDFYADAADRQPVLDALRRHGEVRDHEIRLRRADGTTRWVSLTVQRLAFNGEPALATALLDVTERRATAEALRLRTRDLDQRTQELEAIFRALPDLYFRMAPDGTILDYRAGRQFGLYVPPEEFLGRRIPDVLPPPVGAQTAEALATVARTGEPVGFEYVLPLGDEPRSFEARLLPIEDGQIISVVRDVTDRKTTEEALRASEASYRGLFDNLSELVYVQDLEGRFLAVNEAVVRAYGYTRDDLIGQTPLFLSEPGAVDLEAFADTFDRAVNGEPQRFEWWGRRKDGSTFPKEVAIQRSTYFGQDVIIAVGRDISERVEAEEALRQREEHFRRLIENSSDQVLIVDATGAVTYAGPSVERLLGFTPEEMLGTRPADMMHPDDVAHTMEAITYLMAHPGEVTTTRYRTRHKDGRWRVHETVARTLDPASADSGIVANCRDVTDSVEAEEILRIREEHFRRLIENASDLIQVVTPGADVMYSSPSVERILGYAPEEIAATSTMGYIHPDDQPRVQAEIMDLLAHPGTTRSTEYRVLHKDGRWRHFEARGRTVSPTSADEGFIVNARDITERVEAEDALRASEEHFRRLTENASDMIQIVDLDARIVYTGPSVERLLGYTPDEILGTNAMTYLHPDDVERVVGQLGRLAEAPGTTLVIGYRVRHKDGHWRHHEANCRTLSPDGPEEGFVANIRDVTDRIEAEDALRRAQDRLAQQEKMAGLGRMAAGIAHELKNPLNFITNFSDLTIGLADELATELKRDPARPVGDALGETSVLLDDLSSNARKIAEHGRRADAIIRGMMDHARAQPSGRQAIDINALVRTNTELADEAWRTKDAGREAALTLDLARDVGEVEGSGSELGRVIVNLVTNALDAVEAQAQTAGEPYDPHVTVRTRRTESSVQIVVEDNGVGVPEEVRPRLFEPFFTTKPTGEGNVGLGLSLSRDVIEEGHDGTLEVESREGEGATFTITLPVLS